MPVPLRIAGWKAEYLNDWIKLYEWLNDCTVTGCQIAIYVKTGIIKLETKIYQGYQFWGEEYLLGLNFKLKSHGTIHFMKVVLAVCRVARYR